MYVNTYIYICICIDGWKAPCESFIHLNPKKLLTMTDGRQNPSWFLGLLTCFGCRRQEFRPSSGITEVGPFRKNKQLRSCVNSIFQAPSSERNFRCLQHGVVNHPTLLWQIGQARSQAFFGAGDISRLYQMSLGGVDPRSSGKTMKFLGLILKLQSFPSIGLIKYILNTRSLFICPQFLQHFIDINQVN